MSFHVGTVLATSLSQYHTLRASKTIVLELPVSENDG